MPYHSISYSQDIRGWLEFALPEVRAPNVHETIQQYVNVVRDISME